MHSPIMNPTMFNPKRFRGISQHHRTDISNLITSQCVSEGFQGIQFSRIVLYIVIIFREFNDTEKKYM